MKISIIVAKSENNIIGLDNNLPWRLSADLKYFKKTTLAKPIVMGRKTFESIGKPLPGRDNIVLTRQSDLNISGVRTFSSIEDAIADLRAKDCVECMIIGGANIYKQALSLADRLYITKVHANIDGDTYFPNLDDSEWNQVSIESHPADDKNQYPYSFVVLDRN